MSFMDGNLLGRFVVWRERWNYCRSTHLNFHRSGSNCCVSICGNNFVNNFFHILPKTCSPITTVKYPVPNTEIYVSPSDYGGLNEKEMLKYKAVVFAFQGPLTFLSVVTFRTDLENKILLHLDRFHTSELQTYTNSAFEDYEKEGTEDDEDVEKGEIPYSETSVHKSKLTIILDLSQTLYIDLCGLETLQKTYVELKQQNINLVLAACSTSVLSTLERADFFNTTMSKSECFPSLHDAVVGHRQICVINSPTP